MKHATKAAIALQFPPCLRVLNILMAIAEKLGDITFTSTGNATSTFCERRQTDCDRRECRNGCAHPEG